MIVMAAPMLASRSSSQLTFHSAFRVLYGYTLPPEMGEIAQTFMSEIEWLVALKCRATGLSTSLFLAERRCSEYLSDGRPPVSLV